MPARIDGQDVTLLNVSTGGALVQHALPLRNAAQVELEMQIGELEPLRVIAAVAWTRDASEFAAGYASGIAFEQALELLGVTLEQLATDGRAIAIGWNDEPLEHAQTT